MPLASAEWVLKCSEATKRNQNPAGSVAVRADGEFDGAVESLELLPGNLHVAHQWHITATVKNMATGRVTQLVHGT